MSYNNHAHLKLCSTQRGSVVQTRHPANVQHRVLTHDGYQGPGSYDVEKPPAVQASEGAGREQGHPEQPCTNARWWASLGAL